jgi:hypothetical protein
MSYRRGNGCTCARCRMNGIMGPVVLITLGVLFMLDSFNHVGFQCPVLLIVIGLVKVLQYSASDEGHNPAGYMPQAPIITPPPVPPSGNLPAVTTDTQPGSSIQGYEENRNG